MDEKIDNLNSTGNQEDTEKEQNIKNNKLPLWVKIFIFSLIFIIVLLITVIIIILVSKSDTEEKNEDEKNEEKWDKAGYIESWNDLYGIKMSNISYIKKDLIENTFKKGGVNFKEEIGDLNNGKDYKKNERNIYDLYIPYSTLYKKDKYNGIILMIHGGSWVSGSKEDIDFLCSRYAKAGYITATMGYTLLSGDYPEFNIYRILDEINSCNENIKEQLKNIGFDETKLEMAIGGISAGAHIALLYGYSIKKTPIPLKFLINIVGPLNLESEYWYKPAVFNETLENINPSSIENAIKEGKIVKIFEDPVFVDLMNGFLGKRYTEEETKEMIENNKIKTDSKKYQELYNAVKYSFPYKFIDSNTLPTICEYGGNDSLVGVSMYKLLKELSDQFGNKLDLVYMRYGEHNLISYDTENGIEAMRKIHYQILNYAKAYFTSSE